MAWKINRTANDLLKNQPYALFLQDGFEALETVPNNSIDCIWTDPPYFLSNGGISFQSGKVVPVDKGVWDQSKGVQRDLEFHKRWIQECHRILKPNGTIWVSGTYHSYLLCGFAMIEIGFQILNDIIWEKPNPPPNVSGRRFVHSSETLLWATKPIPGRRLNYFFDNALLKSQNGNRPMRNIWRMAPASAAEKTFGRHPTQKPIALIRRCLEASTRESDVVVDPFMGSGSTGVAAREINRLFIGIEADKNFLELARRRINSVDFRTSGEEWIERNP